MLCPWWHTCTFTIIPFPVKREAPRVLYAVCWIQNNEHIAPRTSISPLSLQTLNVFVFCFFVFFSNLIKTQKLLKRCVATNSEIFVIYFQFKLYPKYCVSVFFLSFFLSFFLFFFLYFFLSFFLSFFLAFIFLPFYLFLLAIFPEYALQASRPVAGFNQVLVQWVPGNFALGWSFRDDELATHLN